VGRGTLIAIAGPSGVGKGTVVQRLLARDPDGPALSVSVTTRAPRPGELDGVHYRFVSDAEFDLLSASAIRAGT
jgi:guanylate kinase